MGFLAPLAMLGGTLASSLAGAAGASTAAGAASASMGLGAASTGLAAAGSIVSGISGYQQGMFQSKVAEQNAALARTSADQSLLSGTYEEGMQRIKTGQKVAQTETGAAARGLDVNAGVAQDLVASARTSGEMDALAIRYQAAKSAWGYNIEAQNQEEQAHLDRMSATGALVGGILGAGQSTLSGASSLANKWVGYKQSGAM